MGTLGDRDFAYGCADPSVCFQHERDVIYQAAVSGGKEARVLEKAVTAIMVRLGFDQAEHIGQRKAPRKGGYPDIRIKASSMVACGFADTKATARYGMGISDTLKLQTYYKNCWNNSRTRARQSISSTLPVA